MVRVVATGRTVTEALTEGAQDPRLLVETPRQARNFSHALHGAPFQNASLYPKAPG